MYAKDKKLLEKGYLALLSKLGEEKTSLFFDLFTRNGLDYKLLKALCDELEEERRKKEEAAKAAMPVFRKITNEEYATITKDYKQYLEKVGIKYLDHQGFDIRINTTDGCEEKHHWVTVRRNYDGSLMLSCYVGRLFEYKVRPVKRLKNEMEKRFPSYSIYLDKFPNYSNEYIFDYYLNFTNVEELHESVLKLVKDVDEAIEIAVGEFGNDFEPCFRI